MTFDAPIPFDEAIAYCQQKGLLPTNLSSAQLSRLKTALKQRAWFSARMDKASVLQVLGKNVEQIAGGMGIADENGRTRSVAEAKAQLREAMVEAGVPFGDENTPTIKDFYSDARRDLMVRTNLLDVLGAGRHIASQDPVALDVNPGLELIRMVVPKGGEAAERDWIQRWHDAMDEIGDAANDGCTDPDESDGRMVALVNHPIWQALGDGAGGYDDTLGNPWAPFAFNSGMNTIAVSRSECVELEIIDEDDKVQPDDDIDIDINENLEARVEKFSAAMQDALTGGGLKIVKGVLRLANRAQIVNARAGLRGLLDAISNSGTSEGAYKGWDARREGEKRKGVRAIKTALREKRDAISAMWHPGFGAIDFPLDKRGGKGLLKIVADHGEEAALHAPHVIAYGNVLPRNGNTQVVEHEGSRVVLTQSENKDRRHWMLTAYDSTLQKKRPLMNSGRDFTPSSLRLPGLHWPRPGKGAVTAKANLRLLHGRIKGILQEAA